MATTPRKYLWQFCTRRADDIEGLGGVAHYYTAEAQSLYLKDGISTKELAFEEGHWEDAVEGEEDNINTDEYTQLSFTHPATGSLYGSAILPDEEGDEVSLYLLRYTYAKDIGNLINSAKWGLQIDNPINQLSASIKNYSSDAFTKSSSLFQPGAKAVLGLTMGDSEIYKMGTIYLDDVDFKYNSPTVSLSGRNVTGYILKDSTFNIVGKKTDTISNLCAWVLDMFGIDKYMIQENNTQITYEYDASRTGLQALQDIADKASGFDSGTDWDIEEMWDGTIIIGYNSFRSSYLPKSVFKFDKSDLFKRSSTKVIDGAYSKVYCTGTDANGHELTPVVEEVTTWKWWNVVPNKTYFAPTLENTTQAELVRYAKMLAKQYKKTGLNESYSCSIKPQLLVGDFATAIEDDGDENDIGIITQVNHSFGEKGYGTDFVADSGGDKQTLLTRSASTNENVYTSTRRMGGDNRTKRLYDYIQNTAKQIVRTSPGGGGGTTGVQDVLVDGTSVVSNNVANISLSDKQDALTAGDRISISQNTISANIAPFSIVNGKMCITYKEEVE